MILTKGHMLALSNDEFERLHRLVTSAAKARAKVSPVAAILAGLRPGEVCWLKATTLSTHRKRAAQRLLGNDDAHWIARSFNKGLKVTRIR